MYARAMAEAVFENGKEGKSAPVLRGALVALRAISSKRGIGYREEKGTGQTLRPANSPFSAV